MAQQPLWNLSLVAFEGTGPVLIKQNSL